MNELTVYTDTDPANIQRRFTANGVISQELARIRVRFEQAVAASKLIRGAMPVDIQKAYGAVIEREQSERHVWNQGPYTLDVVGVGPSADADKIKQPRADFRAEHTHDEDEIRIFHEGGGNFYLHEQGYVYVVRCETDNMIGIPAQLRHGFDMGANPYFTAVRFLGSSEGYKANKTGSDILEKYPDYEA